MFFNEEQHDFVIKYLLSCIFISLSIFQKKRSFFSISIFWLKVKEKDTLQFIRKNLLIPTLTSLYNKLWRLQYSTAYYTRYWNSRKIKILKINLEVKNQVFKNVYIKVYLRNSDPGLPALLMYFLFANKSDRKVFWFRSPCCP